jgi:toxin-antitoxin system PIN domain toxin
VRIAVDTNILVYSHRAESPHHAEAAELIDSLRRGAGSWAIPWPCVHEFIAVVTSARIFKKPTPTEVAFAVVDAWLAGQNLHFLSEGSGHLEELRGIATRAQIQGPRIHDARVAALCLQHGASELLTADRDFSSFPRLKTRNPFVKA